MRLDTTIALSCLIFAMSLAYWSLSRIVATEQESISAFDAMLVEGTTLYELKSGDSCFGTVESSINFRSGSIADWSSNITASFNEHPFSTLLQGRVGVNKLGQVNGISISLTNEYSSLQIESRTIAPIELTVKGHLGNQAVARSFTVPGPIVLHPRGERHYQTVLPRSIGTNRITPVSHLVSSVKETLALAITPSQGSSECKTNPKALRLDPLISRLGGLFTILGSLSLSTQKGDDI